MIFHFEKDDGWCGEQSVDISPKDIIDGMHNTKEFRELCGLLNQGMDREFTSIFIEEFVKEYKRSCTSRDWISSPLEAAGYKLVKV